MQLLASLLGDQAFLRGIINSVAVNSNFAPLPVVPKPNQLTQIQVKEQFGQTEREKENEGEKEELSKSKRTTRRKKKHRHNKKSTKKEVSENHEGRLRNEARFDGQSSEKRNVRNADNDKAEVKETMVNVYIKNLPDTMTTERLQQYFAAFEGCNPYLSMDPDNQRCRGFGFITMTQSGFEELKAKNFSIEGRQIWIGLAQKKKDRETELKAAFAAARARRNEMTQGLNLVVSNLSFDMDSDQFRELFAPLGAATSIYLGLDDKGRSRGFGFAAYATREDAQRVMELMNNKLYNGRPMRVAVHVPK